MATSLAYSDASTVTLSTTATPGFDALVCVACDVTWTPITTTCWLCGARGRAYVQPVRTADDRADAALLLLTSNPVRFPR